MTPARATVPGLTLDESARRLGELVGARRIEFERLGAWARLSAEPRLTVALARLSAHQGWAAQQLEALLPVTRDHDPEAVIAAGRPTLVPGTDPPAGVALVEEVRDGLARLIDAAESLAEVLSPVSDAPARRLLWLLAESDRRDLESLRDPRIAGEDAQVSQ